jgi:hypothetical protein
MVSKKRGQSDPHPYAGLRRLLELITVAVTVPPLETVLELGRELEQAGLRYFINGALPAGNADPNHFTRNLVYTACRCHWAPDSHRAAADSLHVRFILRLIEQRPGFWPFVRDELRAFAALVVAELGRRAKPTGCEGQPSLHEDWLPASEAVAAANARGYGITLDWLSKRKARLRTRPPELPGKHRLEVEMNSLAVLLFREARPQAGNTDTDEPGPGEREGIEARKRDLRTRRRPLPD